MVERGKNNPAIVMWSIGNEVGEADGSNKICRNCSSVGQDYQDVDATRYVTMGLINSALAMDQEAMKR